MDLVTAFIWSAVAIFATVSVIAAFIIFVGGIVMLSEGSTRERIGGLVVIWFIVGVGIYVVMNFKNI